MEVVVALLVILAIFGGLIALLVRERRKNNKGKPPKTMKDRLWGVVIAIIALAIVMLLSLPRMWSKQQLIDEIKNSSDTSQQAP